MLNSVAKLPLAVPLQQVPVLATKELRSRAIARA
jgi:hypothetical protein